MHHPLPPSSAQEDPGSLFERPGLHRLFAYPSAVTPDSLKSLYVIAWRYIIRDFYRVKYESYEFHYIPALEATLIRFSTLVRGRAPPILYNSARTGKAAQGRKPKIKTPRELSTPIFTEDEKGRLKMSDTLRQVAEALGLAERLA